jgi:sarcosine oxidase gamma subunit
VNIAMAIADTAQAFIKSMAQWGSPLGLVFGGIAAAAGAVNIGIMAAQMAKMATGGVVGGDPSTGDSQHVMLTPGELVMNQKQQANTLMAVANGRNAQKPPINVTGGATTVVIQGNADRVVVEGALRANRQQQMKDMKALLKDMQYAGLVRLQVA